MDEVLLKRLRDALKGRESVAVGQFSWINLDLVREEAGEDWPRLKAKVYAVASHFLDKRLGPKDVVMRFRGGFMVVFGTLEGAAAEERIKKISTELNAFFVGERAFRNVSVQAKAATVSPEQMMSMISEEQARKRDAAACEAERGPNWERFGERRPERHYHREETGLPRGSGPTQVEPSAARAEAQLPLPAATDREGDVRAPHVETESTPVSSRPIGAVWFEPAFKEEGMPWSEIVFRPCWDSRTEMISSNMCLARRSHKGRYYYGRDTLLGRADPFTRRRLDASVAYAAQKSFLLGHRSGKPCALVIPVFYDTVRRAPDRIEYLATLRVIPKEKRQFFSLRVMEIPTDVAPGQIQEVLGSIWAAGFNILANLPFGHTNLERFEWCHVAAFGCAIPDRASERGFGAADRDALSRQVRAARNLGAQTYLTTVNSADVIPDAMSAGVRYFTGVAIAEETPHPVPLTPLPFGSILSRVGAE